MELLTKRFVLLLIATFFYMTSLFMGNPIIAGFCGTLGGSGVIMGIASGVSNLSSLCCRPFTGTAVDRYNRRLLAIAGLFLMFISNLGYYFSTTPIMLIGSRLLGGIGFAVSSVTLSTCVATSLPKERIGEGMGIYGMVQALGMAVAPSISLQIVKMHSYYLAFIIAGLFALVALLIICFKDDICIISEHNSLTKKKENKQQLIAFEALPVAAIVFLTTLPYSSIAAFLATFAHGKRLGIDISLYFPIYAAGLIVSRVFLSRFFDKLNYRLFVTFCLPLIMISLILINFMNLYVYMVVAAILMSLGYGVLVSVSQANIIRRVDPSKQGVANSTYYIGLDAGLAAGPIIAGEIYTHLGSQNLFLFLSIAPILGFIFIFKLRKAETMRATEDV